MSVNCPKCDADISETYEGDDWSCGIVAGYYCDACDLGIAEWEIPREPLVDDVPVFPAREPGEQIGTPISQLSTRPGEPGYDEWCRISRSCGHD